jgi:hypothetical protein
MGHTNIAFIDDPLEGELLVAEGEQRKGGAYIARITGTDPKYRYARDFISESRYIGEYKSGLVQAFVRLNDLREPWDLLEIRAGGSWKNDYRDFYLYEKDTKNIRRITEGELRERLAELKKLDKQSRIKSRQVIKLQQKGGDK